eukprot:GHRR01012094.1.p1 GENE.GHRR01012094.1~~GHRR01012094.1.p1  ORF type:complete len:596 (+),score=199.38 GHRR01012094.1:4052-5839(+)
MASKAKPVLPLLEAGPVPLVQLRAQAKKQLVDLIDSRRGKKALILDPAISGSLTQLDAGLSELFTEHGIIKLLYLERVRLDDAIYNASEPHLSDVRPILYVARATLENAQLIAWQIKSSSARSPNRHEYSVFWVPRRSVAVEHVLEDEGVYGDVIQGEFPLDMVPLDDDVLSLELDSAFRECTLEGDPSSLFYTASALMRLQYTYGLIPRIQGKGPAAAAVKDMAIRIRKEGPLPLAAATACRIHRAIILDREIDPITPMVTQITFEGLIDEITGIKNGSVMYTPSKREGAGPAGGGDGGRSRPGSTLLNSTDPFYKEFRDLPYYITSQRLQQYARDARKEYAELGSKDLSELKTFVKGLPKLLLLDRLSDLAVPVAEVVKEQAFHDRLKAEQDILEGYDVEESVQYIQEQMWRGAEALAVLRLLSLFSSCCGGLPKKHADSMRSEFLAAYGHQHLATLNNLEKAGLVKPQGSSSTRSSTFASLRKGLRLIVDDPDQMTANPSDISYLHKGYAPISIRLVEAAVKGGWGPVAEVLSILPGAQFDILQVLDPDGRVVDRPYKAVAAAGEQHPPYSMPAIATPLSHAWVTTGSTSAY